MNGIIASAGVLIILAILESSALDNGTASMRTSIPYAIGAPFWPVKLQQTRKSFNSKSGSNKMSKLSKKMKKWLKKTEKKAEPIEFDPDIIITSTDDATPFFQQVMPVNGTIPEDGCDSNSVPFKNNGICYPLLSRGPCNDPKKWVTVDPYTFEGRCTPRLCGRDRVFVVRDGLCHDIYDPVECQGGRRLYFSPYGDPICDCPIGHYPFPYPGDDCVPLFTQGPCPYRNVLTIDSSGSLECTPSQCAQSAGTYGDKYPQRTQWVPTKNGVCYELGTDGPCSSSDSNYQLLGYDILKGRLECVDVTNPNSPYFSSPEENALLDIVYDQFHPEYDVFRIWLVYHSLNIEDSVKPVKKKNKKVNGKGYQQRQGSLGIVQTPSSTPLLNPSRSGTGQGKGTNPIVPDRSTRDVKQVVKPGSASNCQGKQVFNAATGQCRNPF